MLVDYGWTIKSLVSVLGTILQKSGDRSILDNSSLQLTAAILESPKELRKSLSSRFTDAIHTSENVVECAARTFHANTARMVVGFVKGE